MIHATAIGEALVARGQRVAVCETTAGGLISAHLLAVPGASAWFDRGAVAYGGTSKQDYTGVSTEDLRAFGAVSTDAVAAMARGLQQLAGVAWAVAESGIAGPQTSRRSVKPVGTVCLAIVGPAGTEPHTEEAHIDGDRAQVMVAVAEVVLARLRRAVELSPLPPPH